MPDSCLEESIIKHFHTVSYFSLTSVRASVDVCASILNFLIFSAEFRIMARGINEDTKRSMPEHTFSRYVSLATDISNGQYGHFNLKKWEFGKALSKSIHETLQQEYVSYISIIN